MRRACMYAQDDPNGRYKVVGRCWEQPRRWLYHVRREPRRG